MKSNKKDFTLTNSHLLTLEDYSADEIYYLLNTAHSLKNLMRRGKKHELLKGKTIAVMFASHNLRARLCLELAIRQLGAHPMFIHADELRREINENIGDTARLCGRYGINAAVMRGFELDYLREFVLNAQFPVINDHSTKYHPSRTLSDLFSIYEIFERVEGLKITYFGRADHVANSLLSAGARLGADVWLCCPPDCVLDPEFLSTQNSGKLTICHDPIKAAENSSVIYTGAFFSSSVGTDPALKAALMPYQINAALMAKAQKDAVYMHCLPAHRGEEVTADVIDGPQSIIYEQSENRLHIQKAILSVLG